MWSNENSHTSLVERQRDRNHQDTLEEKQSQRIFFTEYEVLKCEKRERERESVSYWQGVTQTDQWNRTENPETDSTYMDSEF